MAQNYYTSIDMHNNPIDNLPNATNNQQPATYGQIIKKYVVAVGNGSELSFTVNHNLNTQNVLIQVRLTDSPFTFISPSTIQATDANNAMVSFSSAPTTNQYTVIIIG